MKKVFSLNVLILLLTFGSSSLAAGDAQRGSTKVSTCLACHGQNGVSNNDLWPNLKGQKQSYLSKQIRDFKAGLRKDALMSPMAMSISDQDIDDIAAYFSSL